MNARSQRGDIRVHEEGQWFDERVCGLASPFLKLACPVALDRSGRVRIAMETLQVEHRALPVGRSGNLLENDQALRGAAG